MKPDSQPLVSCIIATRNAAIPLRDLLESLAVQTFRDFEVIVQDNVSNDTTLDILTVYASQLPVVNAQSEPDEGIYDAWNKAVSRARGIWTIFLGADDIFQEPEALASVASILRAQPIRVLYVATPVIMGMAGDNTCDTALMVQPCSCATRDLPQGMAFPHQGLFHRTSLFQKFTFNTEFHIAGDYDFVARTFQLGDITLHNTPVVRMALGGVSSRIDSLWRVECEQWHIARRHFPQSFPWKIGMRLLRSLLCAGIAKVFGVPKAEAFADILRHMRGKKSLWSATAHKNQ